MKQPALLVCFLTCMVLLAATNGQQTRTRTSKFCDRYKCQCPDPIKEIKCQLNATIREVDFGESDVQRLDLSENSLEAITWGDTSLNLRELILRANNITVIHQFMFTRVPHLHLLDLSANRIAELKEEYFTNLNVLEKLNLSSAFAADYRVSNELCELVSLRVLDLSYLDLGELKLDCWRTSPHLVEIHARYARNIEASAINWLPVIGGGSGASSNSSSTLRLIDLTGSDLKRIDLSMWLNMNSLVSLSLSHMPALDKNSLVALLKSTPILKRLKYLHVANISADGQTLPIDEIVRDQRTALPLELLDISSNRFAGDLNKFLFNQLNLSNLMVLRASGNGFARCDVRLVMGERASALRRLEQLDLSHNAIDDTSCLYSIRPITTLKSIDLSHNRIGSEESSRVRAFSSVFSLMPQLEYLDLSHNNLTWLVLYFNTNLTMLRTLDVSANKLTEFQVLSLTMLRNGDFPHESKTNGSAASDEDEDELLNMQYIDEEDNKEDADEDVILDAGKNKPDEDDQRFLLIERLDLSRNRLVTVNFQLMFQSLKNIVYLNMSENPIEIVISMSFGAWPFQLPPHITKNSSSSALVYPMNVQDEMLCVDRLDLSNCKIHRMPALPHTCINTIDMRNNLLKGSARLAVSNYTLYFLDYVDLRGNNVTNLHVVKSEQKFVQDDYKAQNSPINYFYGRTNTTRLNHTLIDLRDNPFYRCDCGQVRALKNTGNIRVLNECFDERLIARCRKNDLDDGDNKNDAGWPSGGGSGGNGARQLNKRLKILFAVTCVFLIVFSMIIIYYMCSDFVSQLKPYERVRVNTQRWLAHSSASLATLFGRRAGPASASADKNIGVKYTELRNDATSVSQIEINNT